MFEDIVSFLQPSKYDMMIWESQLEHVKYFLKTVFTQKTVLLWVVILGIIFISKILLFFIFKNKLNEPWWKALIPFVNISVLCKHTFDEQKWRAVAILTILFTLPLALFVIYRMFIGFNKNWILSIFACLLPPLGIIFLALCAFDKYLYSNPTYTFFTFDFNFKMDDEQLETLSLVTDILENYIDSEDD